MTKLLACQIYFEAKLAFIRLSAIQDVGNNGMSRLPLPLVLIGMIQLVIHGHSE